MPQTEIASEKDIPLGKMKTFKVEGETILVYHLKDGFYATQSLCTHTLGPLKYGKILDNCKIQCPLHHARFNIKTGKVIDWANFPPGIQILNFVRSEKALKTYKVKRKNGKLFIT